LAFITYIFRDSVNKDVKLWQHYVSVCLLTWNKAKVLYLIIFQLD